MEHLTPEQLFQIALTPQEGEDLQPLQEHLQQCSLCQKKIKSLQQKCYTVTQIGKNPMPEGLALKTYQRLQNHPTLVQSRRLYQWLRFSPASRTLVLSAVVIFICFGLFTPRLSEAKTVASKDACKAHLKTLYKAVMSYVETHGEYPPTNRAAFLTTLYKSDILRDPQAFLCPGAHCFGGSHPWLGPEIRENVTYPALLEKDELSSVGYEGRYFPIHSEVQSHYIPIIWDKAGNHEKGRNILFLDGHVEFISEEKFQQLFESRFHDYPLHLY